MDKPRKLSHKDYTIRKLAVKLMIPESELERVINHNYQYVNSALHNVCEIELSGFGRIYLNINKVKRDLKKVENCQTPTCMDLKENLKKKLNQYENLRSIRGVEEQPATQGSSEGEDSFDIKKQDGDMQQLCISLQEP